MSRKRNRKDRERCALRAFQCCGDDIDKKNHMIEIGRMQRTIKRLKKSLSLEQLKWQALNDYTRFEFYTVCANKYNHPEIEEEMMLRLRDLNYFRAAILTVRGMASRQMVDAHKGFIKSGLFDFNKRERLLLQFIDNKCELLPDISLCCFFDEQEEMDAFIEFARSNEFQDAYKAFLGRKKKDTNA